MKTIPRSPTYKLITPKLNVPPRKLRPLSSSLSPPVRNQSEKKDSKNIFKSINSDRDDSKKNVKIRSMSDDVNKKIQHTTKRETKNGLSRYYDKYSDFMKSSLELNKDSFKLIGSRRYSNSSIDFYLKDKKREKVYNQFNPMLDEDIQNLLKIIDNADNLSPKDLKRKVLEKKWEILSTIEITPLALQTALKEKHLFHLKQTERSGVSIRKLEYENTLSKRMAVERIERKFMNQLLKEAETKWRVRRLEEDQQEMAKKIQRSFRNYRFRYTLFKSLFSSYIRKIQTNWRIYKFRKFQNSFKALKVSNNQNLQYLGDEFNLKQFGKNLKTEKLIIKNKMNNRSSDEKIKNTNDRITYPIFPNPRIYDIDYMQVEKENSHFSFKNTNSDVYSNIGKSKIVLETWRMTKKNVCHSSIIILNKIISIQKRFRRILSKRISERKMRQERNKAFKKIPLKNKLQLFLISFETKVIGKFKIAYFKILMENSSKLKPFIKNKIPTDIYFRKRELSTHTRFNSRKNSSSEINLKKPIYLPFFDDLMKFKDLFFRLYKKLTKQYSNSIKEMFSVDVFSTMVKFKLLTVLDKLILGKLIEKCFYKLFLHSTKIVEKNEKEKTRNNNLRDHKKNQREFKEVQNEVVYKNQIYNFSEMNKPIKYAGPENNSTLVESKNLTVHRYSTANFRGNCNNLITRNEFLTFSQYS